MSVRPVRRSELPGRVGIVLSIVCFGVAGCGEDKQPAGSGIIQVPAPAAAPVPQESTTSARNSDTGSNTIAAARGTGERRRGSRRIEEPLPSDDRGLPAETMLASEFDPTADHERWLASAPNRLANEADLFAVVIPERGVDSSQFEVAHRPADSTVVPGRNSDFKLPGGFAVVDEAGWTAEGYPRRLRGEKDGSVMVFVPAGTFLQGTNAGPLEAAPEHAVELDAFYIDQAEVTHEQFERFRADVRDSKRIAAPARSTANPREPVMGISWADAFAYATWAGKQLPSEAQWEKAGRGPNGFAFPWGRGRPLWTRSRQPGQIDAVMSFVGDVSPAGAFDLAGNAREWCADWFTETTYKQIVSGGTVPSNPTGPKNPPALKQHVVKGDARGWNLWARSGAGLGDRPKDVGFRCVWVPKTVPAVTAPDATTGSTAKPDRPTKAKGDGF